MSSNLPCNFLNILCRYYDRDTEKLYIHFCSQCNVAGEQFDIADHVVEVTNQRRLFAPHKRGMKHLFLCFCFCFIKFFVVLLSMRGRFDLRWLIFIAFLIFFPFNLTTILCDIAGLEYIEIDGRVFEHFWNNYPTDYWYI